MSAEARGAVRVERLGELDRRARRCGIDCVLVAREHLEPGSLREHVRVLGRR